MNKYSLGNPIVNCYIIRQRYFEILDYVAEFDAKIDGVYVFLIYDYPLKYEIEFYSDDDFISEISIDTILELDLTFFQITESRLIEGEFQVINRIGFNEPLRFFNN